MVRIEKNKLHIEIETTSPHEDLYYFSKSLLRLLMDSQAEYPSSEDYKGSAYQLLTALLPDIDQLEKGV